MSGENVREVWRYPLRPGLNAYPTMPTGAEMLSVGVKLGGDAHLWAIADPHAPSKERFVLVVGTGHQIDPKHRLWFIGTWVDGNNLVWHAFEVLEGGYK